jgi:dihydroxyacid dehydratase/phosphogluconate dehydratase
VLRNAGPLGGPGMPEWGVLPLPKKLLQAGVRDMVRVSDARMSGTAFGTVVVHVAPESAAGGPLAAVRDGDLIELEVPRRRLELLVEPKEIARRLADRQPQHGQYHRGYGWLFGQHVLQADDGCDFDFLRAEQPTKAFDDEA